MAINEVRKNADMPLIPSMGKDEFMERLYNEWRVEFAFEDHRFWDVRRWKIADTTQRELYGVKIEKQADGTFNFYKNLYETRNWRRLHVSVSDPSKRTIQEYKLKSSKHRMVINCLI